MPTDRNNLSKRVALARAAVPFCGVLSRDKDGRPRHVTVPGTRGKTYSVFLKRGDLLEVECRLNLGSLGIGDWCRGNGIHTICKHGMSAIMVAANEQNMSTAWCATPDDASWRARLGCDYALRIVNKSGGYLFAVVEGEI